MAEEMTADAIAHGILWLGYNPMDPGGDNSKTPFPGKLILSQRRGCCLPMEFGGEDYFWTTIASGACMSTSVQTPAIGDRPVCVYRKYSSDERINRL